MEGCVLEISKLNEEAMKSGSREKLSEALRLLDESKNDLSTFDVAELFSMTSLNLSRLSEVETALQLLDQVIELGRSPAILAEAHLEICTRDPSRLQTHANAALRIAEEALLSLEDVSLAPKLTDFLSRACAMLKMDGAALVVGKSLTEDLLRSALENRKTHAALIIQKWFRRISANLKIVCACRNFLVVSLSAKLIQAVIRSSLARAQIQKTVCMHAFATRVQSWVRGWRVRRRLTRGPVFKRAIQWTGNLLKLVELRTLRFG